MNKKMIIYFLLVFVFFESDIFANEFMFSSATAPVIGLSLLLWLITGLILHLKYPDLVYIGAGSIIATGVIILFLFGHVEVMLMVWMIYLLLLTTYFAFEKRNILPGTKRLNLIFHGTFLLIVICGGIITKIIYWNKMGGFAAWSNWMKEVYTSFLIFFSILTIIVFLRFYFGVLRKQNSNKNKNSKFGL